MVDELQQPLTSAETQAIARELERIEEDCIHSGKAHFNAGDRWSGYHFWIGIPSVVLSALAGAAIVKEYPEWAAACSVLVTILTTLLTFLKPSERATSHKASGDQYLGLRNQARVVREIKIGLLDKSSAVTALEELAQRRDDLNSASLPISRRDFNAARSGIAQGEATHQVDKR
jgi:hypothetical protein